jgi:hypothetical protein
MSLGVGRLRFKTVIRCRSANFPAGGFGVALAADIKVIANSSVTIRKDNRKISTC